VTIDHRAAGTDDGVVCCCGSPSCIVTADGVWTPSRPITAAERDEAVETFTAASVSGWVGRMLRDHRGHGGAVVAEHDRDESLYWRLSPVVEGRLS
jgi:hypothetical protein